MATVNKTRIWQNITITEEIDTSAGKMVLKNSAGTTLATSENKDWVIDDISTFTRNYNSLNTSTNKTEEEFTQFFYVEGVPIFNGDRSDVVNDPNSYGSNSEYNINVSSLFELGVPGVRNPKSGLKVSSKGRKTTQNTRGQTPQTNTLRSDDTTARNLRQSANSYFLSSGGSSAKTFASPSSALLRYPSASFSSDAYDYIQISAHQYKAPGAATNYQDLIGGDRLGALLGTVALPMQPNLTETSTVGWGEGSLDAVEAALATAAGKGIEGIVDQGIGEGLKATVSSLASDAKSFLTGEGDVGKANVAFLKAYFAGQAIGKNITARATGQVINPNLELLFNAPKLRTFSFNFSLTPRDEGESNTIKEIIRFFKRNMNPHITQNSLFLYVPNIFQLEYMFAGGSEHPFLNKIKPCALTQFDVNYAPGGRYSTYSDGSMTQYDLTMQFGELAPIYQTDQDQAGGTGY